MHHRHIAPFLFILPLLFASLACTLDSGDEQIAATEIDFPTPAPTEPTAEGGIIINLEPTAPSPD